MTESLDVHPHPHEHANPVTAHGNPLTRKIGPLPIYGWVVLIVGAYVVYKWWSGRNAASTAVPVDAGATTASGDTSSVGASTGSGSGFGGVSGSGTVVTGPQGATSNSQWASLVLQAFVAAGADPTTVSNALTDYLNGNSLTAAEQAIVNQALTQFGPPPQGVLPVTTTPITPPPTPTTPTVADGYYRDPITTAIYEVYNGQIWHLDPTEWHSVPSSAQHYTSIDSTWAGYKLPQGTGVPPGTSDTAPVAAAPPKTSTPASPPSQSKPPPPKASTRTYTVKSGDSLFSIAQHFYGNGNDWNKIYDANKSKIGSNPNLIHVGTVLVIP